ncbi:protein of unknown function DUF1605 [Trypanosoma melophagium]|uniref:protein of unknown function DUF1605 n=1 Tax=Trypanosoma melophagium TaxID=715481 RepID=UPI00351A4BA0|nr:protein of unknown function DUF1605 [Trypanosoma melophagium]
MDGRRRQRELPLTSDPTAVSSLQDDETLMLGDPADDTEGHVTGNDEVELAYGSAFYLQEDYLQRLRQRHHRNNSTERDNDNNNSNNNNNNNGDGGIDNEAMSSIKGNGLYQKKKEEDEALDLVVNTRLQPLFFRLGKDFPAVLPHTSSTTKGEEEKETVNPPTALAVQNEQSDIILPIVSSTCRLVQSATKGSAMLGFLKRQQEVERTTRAAMDTSKSDLSRLMRKGEAGQQVVTMEEDEKNNKKNINTLDSWINNGENTEEDMEGEAEMLRRKIRLEQAKLDHMLDTKNPNAHHMITNTANNAEIEKEERARQYANTLRRRQAKMDRVQEAKNQLAEFSSHTDDYMAKRLALLAARQQLPIYRCKYELLRCIGENSVCVVVGETGSGKTTQLVQYLYERGYTRSGGGGIIGCTQPRRLAAIGVARRVSEEMGCALGTRVGYAIHLDDCTTEETEIKFMTDGVLLREIVRDPDVSKYSVIVLDEAHERSVNTDVLLGVLKAAVRRRTDLKLVVTSATMDIVKFSKFFGNAPFYEIPGETYDVELQYASAPVDDYVADAVFRVCQLHLQMPLEGKHDILVFMTGRDDVLGVCELIRRRLQELDPKWLDTLLILPCLSEAVNTSTGVLNVTPPGMRKCVVATNVAETSLTIDGIRYVVDCGFMKTNVFRPKLGMNTLQRYPVSQAQANQRKGRAGRTTSGVCFRLYTEAQFTHEMLVSSVPEIQRSSIDSVVLLLKSIGVSRLIDFDFMDPPPAANIRRSMWQLWVLGLLDDTGAITADGRLALEFPLAPSLAKMLVDSVERECAVETVRIVSMISADPKVLFELPKDREETARQHHGRFYVNDSDHLTLLNVMRQFIENGKSRQWAKDHFLHAPTLIRACEVQQQLLERLRQLKLPIVSCGHGGLDRVRQCVTNGFCLQSARRSNTNWSEFRSMLNAGVTCYIHPSSAVCARAEMPLYVVYHDLLLTTREYLVMVTAVEPSWLSEASRGVFCTKKAMRDSTIATTRTITGTTISAPEERMGTAAVSSTREVRPVPPAKGMRQPPAIAGTKLSMLPARRRNNI